MGGRFLDFFGQSNYADRPLAVDVPTLTGAPGAAVVHYSNDSGGPKILSIFDETEDDWFEFDVAALAALSFATLADVDWTTPPTDGQVFAWDTGDSKFKPIDLLYQTLLEITDDLDAAFVDGSGMSIDYTAGVFTFNCAITQYTDELAQDAVAAAFAAGTHTGLTITYGDGANKFDLAVSVEFLQDTVGAMVGSGNGVVPTYDDGAGTLVFNITEASSSQMWTGTSQVVWVTPKKLYDAAAPVSVAFNTSLTIDLNTGINFDVGSLTNNFTLNNFTNKKPGQSGILHMVQDGTGNRVISYGSDFVASGGLAVNGVLSTGLNMADEVAYFCRTDGKVVISILKDVKA